MVARGLTFTADIADDVPDAVQADPLRFKQVLMNLLSNAAKYTPAGEVKLQVSRRAADALGPQRIHCSVRDTGVGIGAAEQQQIFEPFVTVDAGSSVDTDADTATGSGSSGLGLSICRRLVELMGGQIELDSALGQGTTVQFWVPLVIPRELAAQPLADGDVLLLCDDDAVSRLLMSEALARLGYKVVQAASGEEALARWRLGDVRVLITDINMPGLDGTQLIAAVRSAEVGGARRTGIVICSGDPPPAQIDPGSAPLCDCYVSKPVNVATLNETLRHLLGPQTQAQAQDQDQDQASA
jgi:two-component system, NarL family, sensor histidine kinase EvgS